MRHHESNNHGGVHCLRMKYPNCGGASNHCRKCSSSGKLELVLGASLPPVVKRCAVFLRQIDLILLLSPKVDVVP